MKENYEEIYLSGSNAAQKEKAVDETPLKAADDMQDKNEKTSKAPQPVKEIVALRGPSNKVFRMSDGTERAVFYSQTKHLLDEETNQYREFDIALNEEEGGLDYISSGCGFIARFSKDKSDEKLFSIEKDDCKVTAYAKRPKKNKQRPMGIKGSKDKRANQLVVEGMCDATEVEYTVTPDGIKENIIVSEKQNVYRYPFELVCENVTAELIENENKVVFCRMDNGEEVFNIPAPYMTDSKGNNSYSVAYDINQKGDGRITLTVTADSDWINAQERAFPVTIDPQIMLSQSFGVTTYRWKDGMMRESDYYHVIGNNGYQNRMYMQLTLPALPHNPLIKRAKLRFTQTAGSAAGSGQYALYPIDSNISLGYNTPEPSGEMLDYWTGLSSEVRSVEIDITGLLDRMGSTVNLVLKKRSDTAFCDNCDCADDSGFIVVGGSKSTEDAPVLEIDYEPSYSYDSSYASHTHDLGPLGQGVVDLATGNLQFNSEDFSWAGNRMPVTIRHMYNSALSGTAYTNGALEHPIADFSAMKLGHGWKLNLMQSMAERSDGAYIYTDENGNPTELTPTLKDGKCQYIADEITYDPATHKLTMGDDTYTFDDKGRLTAISDGHSTMTLHYTSNRLTTVTDGADRDFGFAYNANGFLTSITAPDGTAVSYTYTGNTLTGITYPSGKQVELRYDPVNPAAIVIKGAYGTPDRNVIYTFSNGRVTNVTEQGEQDGTVVTGATAAYTYSVGSRRTIVTATDGSGEPAVHTVYGFGSDGEVVTKYSYTEKEGSAGITGESAGIDPYTGEDAGVASNINNLLRNHAFDGLTGWTAFGGASATVAEKEITAIHGRKLLNLTAPENGTGGIYQQTVTLPASDYVFSAYVYPLSNSSLHLSVTDLDGTTIASGESITAGDFIRLDLPFTLHTAKAVRVCFNVTGKGAWINAPQLENNPVMNEYNMLVNGNFELGGEGWTIAHDFESITDEACFNMGHSLRLNSNFDNLCKVFQRVKPKSAIGTRETFTLSGWAKGYGMSTRNAVGSTPLPNTPYFNLNAIIYYVPDSDGVQESEFHTAEFAPNTEDWQFASVQFSKEKYKQIDYIMISCEYRYNFGVAYFDDIQLVRNSIETGLTKDDIEPPEKENNNTSTEDTTEQEDTFTEAEDAYGNTITQTQRWKQSESVSYAIYTSSEFSPFSEGANAGNDLVRQTDSRGFNTYYDVDDETSRNMTVTDRCGNKTSYQYDDAGRTTKVTSRDSNGTALAYVDYGYDDNDNLIGITRGDSMGYDLAYNGFNRLESIGVHGFAKPLVAYNYKEGSGRLKEIEYANGDVVHISYDRFGHPILEYWTDACNCTTAYNRYVFDNSGNLARSIDFINQIEYTYTYEEGRVTRSTVNDVEVSAFDTVLSRTLKNSILYFYDEEGRLERTKISDAQGEYVTYFNAYDDDGNVTTDAYLDGNNSATMSSSKDGLDRKISDTVRFNNGAITRNFFYHAGAVTPEHTAHNKVCGTATTNLVSKLQFSNGRIIEYWYDEEVRITRILDSYEGETLYTYDALGQLLSETKNACPGSDCGTTVAVTYDNYGNITSKNGVSYTYGNVLWHDRLTGYGDKTISYDPQGNPTSYLGHNLTWEKGRQLKSFDNIQYTYNSEGIRTSKTVDGIRHDYVVIGAKILKETWNGNVLIPIYNSSDEVVGIYYNCTPYYFYKNLQGDVIGISDVDGRAIVAYSYDAWGACTVLHDNSGTGLANINPYRYRGYYFDAETGLYLTGTRYYNSEVGRFINADGELADVGGNVLGYNIFVYCFNDPVNMDDPTGRWPKWIGKALAVTAVAAVIVASVAITVTTFGAGSVAGVAAISAAVTIAARATEVAVLQAKNSIGSPGDTGSNAGNNDSEHDNLTDVTNGNNVKKKNCGEVATDVVEALFDNGIKIVGIVPYTKAGSIGVNYVLDRQISNIFGGTTSFRTSLSAPGGKVFPYAFAAYAWCQTTISIFSDDPAKRAEKRGYTLK